MVFGRDRTLFLRLASLIGVLLVVSIAVALLGERPGLPAVLTAGIGIAGVGVTLLLLAACLIFFQRVGIAVPRYRCRRCRYRWITLDPRPDIVQTIARKVEAELPRQRARDNQRALAGALVALGAAKTNLEDEEQGRRLSEEGLALARAHGDKRMVAAALNTLGLIALFRGHHERAWVLLDECRGLTRDVGDWQWMAMPLNNLGLATLDGGDEQRAEALFRESLGLQSKLGQKVNVAWGLAGLAEVAITRRQLDRAVRLCAAAQAVCEDAGVPFTSGMRRRYERVLAGARTLLGEPVFATAWANGRMMPQDAAIAYALEDDPQVFAPV
jgi:tetratricopeptide (TPR) repeat protein